MILSVCNNLAGVEFTRHRSGRLEGALGTISQRLEPELGIRKNSLF